MRCKNCGEKFEPKVFLQKYCQKEDCRIQYAMEAVAKQKLAKAKKEKKESAYEKRVLKEKLKTLSDWKKDFQTDINSIIREIDKGYPCMATDTTNGKMNAGHYIGVGANDTLRFHLENIWLQSEHSNTWKSGDTIRYQNGIVATFGKDYLEYMNSLQQIKPIKLTIADVKEKIPIARGVLKWLKLQNRKFTVAERISLRKEFNIKIGLYL